MITRYAFENLVTVLYNCMLVVLHDNSVDIDANRVKGAAQNLEKVPSSERPAMVEFMQGDLKEIFHCPTTLISNTTF